jgi:hypothetical protein
MNARSTRILQLRRIVAKAIAGFGSDSGAGGGDGGACVMNGRFSEVGEEALPMVRIGGQPGPPYPVSRGPAEVEGGWCATTISPHARALAPTPAETVPGAAAWSAGAAASPRTWQDRTAGHGFEGGGCSTSGALATAGSELVLPLRRTQPTDRRQGLVRRAGSGPRGGRRRIGFRGLSAPRPSGRRRPGRRSRAQARASACER